VHVRGKCSRDFPQTWGVSQWVARTALCWSESLCGVWRGLSSPSAALGVWVITVSVNDHASLWEKEMHGKTSKRLQQTKTNCMYTECNRTTGQFIYSWGLSGREMDSFVFENSLEPVTSSALLPLGLSQHWKTNVTRAKEQPLTPTLKPQWIDR